MITVLDLLVKVSMCSPVYLPLSVCLYPPGVCVCVCVYPLGVCVYTYSALQFKKNGPTFKTADLAIVFNQTKLVGDSLYLCMYVLIYMNKLFNEMKLIKNITVNHFNFQVKIQLLNRLIYQIINID